LGSIKTIDTEGQDFPEYPDRKQFSSFQVNIPIGVGLKYFITENTTLSFEIIQRKSFCDYIDNVSKTYIDPALFYAHLDPSLAPVAERLSNKSATDIRREVTSQERKEEHQPITTHIFQQALNWGSDCLRVPIVLTGIQHAARL
jgi:hypothetical protein